MDAIDILGGLLGGKARSGGGGGGSILKDIFGGGAAGSSPRSGSRAPSDQPTDIEREAKELEDLLNVARSRQGQQPTGQSPRYPEPPRAPEPPRVPTPPHVPAPSAPRMPELQRRPAPLPRDSHRQNAQALVLVRAMVCAAKADGEISEEEQQAILDQLNNPSREAIDFLRQEFSRPLDVREFAWSVPLGMEQQVYMLSLSAITLDVQEEADYLRELAHGLRMGPDVCNKIHQQLGAPAIFTEF